MSKEPNLEETFYVLKDLEEEKNQSQRSMAKQHGYSLGKMNFILKALIDKGLVKMVNFAQNKNKTGYRYILTPQGIKTKYEITRSFLQCKELEYEKLRQEIEEVRKMMEQNN